MDGVRWICFGWLAQAGSRGEGLGMEAEAGGARMMPGRKQREHRENRRDENIWENIWMRVYGQGRGRRRDDKRTLFSTCTAGRGRTGL